MEREQYSIGFYFHSISQQAEKLLNHKVRSIDLTKSQCDVLTFLFKNQNRQIIQRDIEHYFHISNPTVTGILNRLSQKGYIQRIRSASDKRVHSIEITPKAKELYQQLRLTRQEMNETFLKGMSPQEQENLLALLEKTLHNLMQAEKEEV
ncbi:MarR family winged helix-turn-helix transcriptional regulator [Dubosiella newyorkensis]|uniref:MarR family winged helix-turn-helix transcriptional regulator n=1 Tax=Dubosiella newyorkensis TaxID=1862672 RepID=UPI00272D4808|nr:MarR family transcriptional regulator [Dubosiella newyorkensis]